MGIIKRIELLGRRLLVALLSLLLGMRRRPVTLGEAPRILVVRLDERVGNLVLLTPLLSSLRARFPRATIDLLANARSAEMLAGHRDISAILPFRKRALFAADGPLRAPWRLRAGKYDLAIDAANPTDPSTTQVILVRLAGAVHTVGSAHGPYARLFSAPVAMAAEDVHELDLRLRLLDAVPGDQIVRTVSLPPPPAPAEGEPLTLLMERLAGRAFVLVNVGARLAEKRLSAEQYAEIAAAIKGQELVPVFAYGPAEQPLASSAQRACAGSLLAPPTNLMELGFLMARATAVVSCDTGPMHIAVAVATPTCGIFVSTDPLRYGYPDAPHRLLDARDGLSPSHLQQLRAWLAEIAAAPPAGERP